MEEFDYKFDQNDPILTLNCVTALTLKIRRLYTENDKNEFEKYFKYLKEKCMHRNNIVTTTAVTGLITLSEGHGAVTTLEALLNDFVAAVSQTENLTGIAQLVFYALDNLKAQNYGIMYNQHPLISIIKKNQSIWPLLLTQMPSHYGSNAVNENLLPFLMYVLYDHESKMDNRFQNNLLHLCKDSADMILYDKIILFSKDHLIRSTRYCKILAPYHPQAVALLILCAHKMMKNNIEGHEALTMLNGCFAESDRKYDIELILLSHLLRVVPVIELPHLLQLYLNIFQKQQYSATVTNALKSILICWKLQFTIYDPLTDRINTTIDKLLLVTPKETNPIPKKFSNVLNEKLYLLQEILTGDYNHDLLLEAPKELLLPLFNHFLAILYGEENRKTAITALNILLKCIEWKPIKSTTLLPVLLYRLTNTTDPFLNLALIRALPKVAVRDENLAMVVTTLRAISSGPSDMQILAISVFYDLFCIDTRCFPYLQALLSQDNTEKIQEYAITKAYVIKEICKKNIGLSVYRSELTIHLSQILNESRDLDYGLPQALAFEGLKYLCRNDIIDGASAWYTLAPRFEDDTRPMIISSLCEMIGEFAFIPQTGPKYDQLIEDVIKKLWYYIINYTDEAIIKAAYNALVCFNLEQVTSGIPEMFSEPPDVFGCIHGNNWLNILKKSSPMHSEHAVSLITELIVKEIKNFRRGVYEVPEQHSEPIYMNLPSYSVLGAITRYVKKNTSSYLIGQNEDVFLKCFKLVAKRYCRPLPPFDWCFLQELIHDDKCKQLCITIASQQAALSGTARRLIDNYMVAATQQKECNNDFIFIYKQLKLLCNSIQPMVLKPFISTTLKTKIKTHNKNNEESVLELKTMIEGIQAMLMEKTSSESSKAAISEIIVDIFENIAFEDDLFEILLECVSVLPLTYLNDLSCPKQFDFLNENIVSRCLKIRCSAALHSTENPFIYLDSFIESYVIKKQLLGRFEFPILYDYFKPVFIKHSHHENCSKWLMELMTKIQLDLADEHDMRRVIFMCTIFIIAISVLSGFYIFKQNSATFEEFSAGFPYGLATLLNTKAFSPYVSQILEWLYDISTNNTYKRFEESKFLTDVFKRSLLILRDHNAFNDKCKWMKYMEVKF